jgi:DNA-binding winged helix-turn-helix (wHTH) protein
MPVEPPVDVRLLGHLEVEVSGARVRFEGVKQRRLFAVLALRGPEAVSTDELVEALWGDEPPAAAGQALQKQISRLRRRLGDGGSLVHHRPPGYALEIDPLAVDSRRFEELLASSTSDPLAGITANPAGVAQGRGSADWVARPEAEAVVIHAIPPGGTTAGGPKIACADLD